MRLVWFNSSLWYRMIHNSMTSHMTTEQQLRATVQKIVKYKIKQRNFWHFIDNYLQIAETILMNSWNDVLWLSLWFMMYNKALFYLLMCNWKLRKFPASHNGWTLCLEIWSSPFRGQNAAPSCIRNLCAWSCGTYSSTKPAEAISLHVTTNEWIIKLYGESSPIPCNSLFIKK